MARNSIEDLSVEVVSAVEDAVIGEIMSMALLNRAKTAAMAVLHRRRIVGSRVTVSSHANGIVVNLHLPKHPTPVRCVVLAVS